MNRRPALVSRALFMTALLGSACDGPETVGTNLRCVLTCPLVFAQRSDSGTWDIFTIGELGTQLHNLTRDTITDILPTWSPDHRRIAFYSQRDPAGIYIMDADGSNKYLVSTAEPDHVTWSPDGRWIAYGTSDIWTVKTEGPGVAANLTRFGGFEAVPSWSPRGDRIAFACDSRICVMDTTGANRDSLTDGSIPVADPAWSPDGKQIAFVVFEAQGTTTIWVMNADGSNWRRLTSPSAGSDRLPAWSPTGAEIAFQRAYGDSTVIRIVSADGTRQRRVVGGVSGHASW